MCYIQFNFKVIKFKKSDFNRMIKGLSEEGKKT